LLLLLAFAQAASAQNNPLIITNTYFVTGDYVVGGWQKTSTGKPINGVPYVSGKISIPDCTQATAVNPNAVCPPPIPPIPAGADIVAAFLYWETVESTSQLPAHPGQNGFFNGHAFTGSFLPSPTPNAPTSWSSGGCSGSSQGAKTIQGYRADVRPFLPVDTNSSSGTFGNSLANGNFTVLLADSGSNGNTTPFTLGATLVVIYRVLAPTMPLNSIVLYDGTYAPSNTSLTTEFSQLIMGFYQAAASPSAKLTYIVGNGQPNKSETVSMNGANLSSVYTTLYPTTPFPGIYNGSWDNPTWPVSALVNANAASATTTVSPTPTNGNCIDWGAVVFSTTVQDTDGDGLLDVWEDGHGYTDAISNQFVALPGADKNVKDIFVEIDYLSNVDGLAGNYKHSHLPKQAALDDVGDAFKNAPVDCDLAGKNCKGVHIHFDVGPNYKGNPSTTVPFASPDPYIIQGGTGGNAISGSAVVCNDSGVAPLCQFPGQPTVAFKGDLLFVRDNANVPNSNPPVPLGNFQPGRGLSYHYVLFGHALGEEESLWTTFGTQVPDPTVTQLVKIVNDGTTTTVTINSPSFPLVPLGSVIDPGDCTILSPPPAACGDKNNLRVTVSGALGQPALNGTYVFTKIGSSTVGTTTTTTLTIPTVGVPPGTYDFTNEPQLSVSYLGPTSSGGHSDFGGGGDSVVTFGLWAADDPANCQADPSQLLTAAQPVYCNNELGSVLEQAGTLMHELGHTLTLTHGGTYYKDAANPSVPTYGLNCKSNFLSSMSYLFVIRGFPDNPGIVDYSGQTFLSLDETNLNESTGIGLDSLRNSALHFTRWFAPPNALDNTLGGGRFPIMHCDGSPIGANEPKVVRVNGSTLSAPIDWDNDLASSETDTKISQDVNFNGSTDAPFDGFNDWQVIGLVDPATGERGSALRQINARAGAFGFSGSGGTTKAGGGTTKAGGGTTKAGGGTTKAGGGSTEQDVVEACSTADPLPSAPSAAMSGKSVVLTWTAPDGPCQVRSYDVRRAQGNFPTLATLLAAVTANPKLFTDLTPKGLTGTPPMTSFTDMSKLQNKTMYTYFVTATNAQGATSRASDPVTILVTF
jgi:hypothetical protein